MCGQRKSVAHIATGATINGGAIFPVTLANMLKAQGYVVTFLNCNQAPTDPGVRRMLGKHISVLQLDTLRSAEVVFNDLGIEFLHSHHAWVDVLLVARK
jgi:hypothetical protein